MRLIDVSSLSIGYHILAITAASKCQRRCRSYLHFHNQNQYCRHLHHRRPSLRFPLAILSPSSSLSHYHHSFNVLTSSTFISPRSLSNFAFGVFVIAFVLVFLSSIDYRYQYRFHCGHQHHGHHLHHYHNEPLAVVIQPADLNILHSHLT